METQPNQLSSLSTITSQRAGPRRLPARRRPARRHVSGAYGTIHETLGTSLPRKQTTWTG
jgi:hypothetical protein